MRQRSRCDGLGGSHGADSVQMPTHTSANACCRSGVFVACKARKACWGGLYEIGPDLPTSRGGGGGVLSGRK